MKFANAPKFDRKSGVAEGGDLLFHFRALRMWSGDSPRGSVSLLTQTAGPSTTLRSGRDAKVKAVTFVRSRQIGWIERNCWSLPPA